ncbi:uncharacterized protein LOC115480505 isoform X2 [Microcaecilia unicolor]|uniref:peptide-methionine (S)-S-oxide reductase n=1 Tax=Microcaecilia unicolor TaxID=1415580 RepID=A0A6P7ZK26_9AMPH|nr:uncharacterized protein LOC115480505 isoform X2 [Microcaecilia unicolor]
MPSKTVLPTEEEALPGRSEKLVVAATHVVNGNPTLGSFPSGLEMALFGMGCFWGVEKKLWQQPGVFSTQVGYAGGYSPNPTYEEVCTGMKQGKDLGTQYRSAIFTYSSQQKAAALKSKRIFQEELTKKKMGDITTEIRETPEFYYAEDYHQQYLHKNPDGYCGLKGTGVTCPLGP